MVLGIITESASDLEEKASELGLELDRNVKWEGVTAYVWKGDKGTIRHMMRKTHLDVFLYSERELSAATINSAIKDTLGKYMGSVTIGDLVIDLANQTVHINGVQMTVTPKPFAILTVLAGEPGHTFSKSEIMSQVWVDEDKGGNYINLKTQIKFLRSQLGDTNARKPKYVATIHNKGYKLVDPKESRAITSPI